MPTARAHASKPVKRKTSSKRKTRAREGSVARRLSVYQQKRNFNVTPEPSARRPTRAHSGQNAFVVQKHDARRLHYDFRLELDGVLLSWSVPKGPSLAPKDRRLSVRTEDHPLDYADFEGIIPKGEYGGGTVLVWDRGTWTPLEDPHEGVKKGKLLFELHGDKLRGRWHLVRTRGRDDKRENWLLFKGKDREAREGEQALITERRPESALTGRTLEEVREAKDRVWHTNGKNGHASKNKQRSKDAPPRPTHVGASVSTISPHTEVIKLVRKLPVQFPLTNLEKELYPEIGLRKAELIAYFVAVAGWMLPHVRGRPLTLVRCPEGPKDSCFFQKHAKRGVPKAVRRISIAEKARDQNYMVVDDAMGLVALAQLGALEVHTWGCHADRPEQPDQFVFDLDPDEALPWDAVVQAACDVRRTLEDIGLQSFVKTTGGKGLHVVLPVNRRHGWDEHKAWAKAFVEQMEKREPKRFVTTVKKSARAGRIFLDYLRNGRGATAIAPYSTRATANATVAAPISWQELEQGIDPSEFNVRSMIQRMHDLEVDPWQDYATLKQSLTSAMRRAVGMK